MLMIGNLLFRGQIPNRYNDVSLVLSQWYYQYCRSIKIDIGTKYDMR